MVSGICGDPDCVSLFIKTVDPSVKYQKVVFRQATMNDRANDLIRQLALLPHPEGGRFAEVYRSPLQVLSHNSRGNRAAVTTIYFMLLAGERARWHVVQSDELWHFYEGDSLDLYTIDPVSWEVGCTRLDPSAVESSPIRVVPAGWWQAARTTGEFTLAGCTVAPGFEYTDYRIFEEGSQEAAEIRRRYPHLTDFL